MLYSLSPDTRVGLTCSSQVNIEVDTDIDFRNVRLPPEPINDVQGQDINIADNVPVMAGFGVTQVSLERGTLNAPKSDYNELFATCVGTSWPIKDKMRAAAGLLWVQSPMDEDARTFGIAMDEMWGVGAGKTNDSCVLLIDFTYNWR